MPISAAHAERIQELQKLYPFFTRQDVITLMELEEQGADPKKRPAPKAR